MRDEVIPAGWTPVGFSQYTNLSSAITLNSTPASGAKWNSFTTGRTPIHAIITAETQAVRYLETATPTATVGQPLATGQPLVIENSPDILGAISFIEQTASAKLNVNYYTS